MRTKLLAVTFGIFLTAGTAYAGPLPGGADSDGDTVEDAFDNCTASPNPSQTDTDHNGCGDTCTQDTACDFDGTASVGTPDFVILKMNFGNAVTAGTNGDCETTAGTGVVGTEDFVKLKMTFGNATGPSGVTTAQCNPATCQCTPQ